MQSFCGQNRDANCSGQQCVAIHLMNNESFQLWGEILFKVVHMARWCKERKGNEKPSLDAEKGSQRMHKELTSRQ